MTKRPVKTERDDLTIDELARRVGMTVRNLREWRALGLLPARGGLGETALLLVRGFGVRRRPAT